MDSKVSFDLPELRAGKREVDEGEAHYALADTGYVFSNNEGDTARKIVAFEARRLWRGSDGRWNPREDDEREVLIAFENPDVVPEDEFESAMQLSAPDAIAFAFMILEAAGVDIDRTTEETGEQYITRETFSAAASLYTVSIPEDKSA